MDNYYDEVIKQIPRLKLDEAKVLYSYMLNEKDENKKKELRYELILRTLYVPYNVIKSNKLYLINNGTYDVDDIINTFNELWIKAIDEGKLLEIGYFSNIFGYRFYKQLSDILISDELKISDYTISTIVTFDTLFAGYLDLVSEGKDSLEEFSKLANEVNHDKKYNYEQLSNTYYLFRDLLKYLEDNNFDLEKLDERKISIIKYLLIDNANDKGREDIENIYEYGMEDYIVSKEIYGILMEQLSDLPENRKSVLFKRYFDNMSFGEVADILGISRSRAQELESSALKKLRRNSAIWKLREVK